MSEKVGQPLSAVRENEGTYVPGLREKAEDPEFRKQVRRFVAVDHAVYRRLRNRYDKLRARRARRPCRGGGYRGRVRLAPGGRLVGYAVHRAVEAILELEIHAGGRLVTRVQADRFRPWLKASGRSRSGVAGFDVPLRRLLLAAGRPFLPATASVRIARHRHRAARLAGAAAMSGRGRAAGAADWTARAPAATVRPLERLTRRFRPIVAFGGACMPRLMLLRHAKSSWDAAGVKDFDPAAQRPRPPRGAADGPSHGGPRAAAGTASSARPPAAPARRSPA